MKPMLFNTEMVRAILDGRKTVTRRVVKPKPRMAYHDGKIYQEDDCLLLLAENHNGSLEQIVPPYQPGDILYVRETWFYEIHMEDVTKGEPDLPSGRYSHRYIYKADNPDYPVNVGIGATGWHPSIHMPKEAARIFLRVTDVRVERLQDMTEDDVCEEGAEPLIQCPLEHPTYEPDGTLGDMCWNTNCCGKCEYIDKSYGELFGEFIWDSTIKKTDMDKYGWAANPFVWVIAFEKVSKEEAVENA